MTNFLPETPSLSSRLTVRIHIEGATSGRILLTTCSLGTHYPIALYAIEHGLHVLVTKPAVQLLNHHIELVEAAKKHNVVCFVEHHKRSANDLVNF